MNSTPEQPTPRRAFRGTPWLLCAVALAATVAIGLAVLRDFPFSEDEYSTLYQAKLFASGRLAADVTHEAFALNQLVFDGQLYSKYEPGWPLLLAPGVLLGLPWLVNPILGAVAIWAIVALGRHLYGDRAAIGAAALCVISPFFLLNTASYYSHPASLAAALLFVLFYIRTVEKGGTLYAVAAGAALGMGLLVRSFDAFVVSVPFAFYSLWLMIRQPRAMLGRLLVMGATVLIFAAALLAYQWAQTGDPLLSPRALYCDPSLLGAPQVGADNPDIDFDLARVWRDNVLGFTPRWMMELMYWLMPFSALFMLVALLGKKSRWERLLWASTGCVVAGYMFHLGSGGDGYGPRYYYAALGFFCLFTARGAALLWSRWSSGRLQMLWRSVVVALLFLGVGASLLWTIPGALGQAKLVVEQRSSVFRFVEEASVHNAVVFIDGDLPEPYFGRPEQNGWFARNDPDLASDVLYARYLGGDAAARLMRESFPSREAYRCTFKIVAGAPRPETIRLEPLAGPSAPPP